MAFDDALAQRVRAVLAGTPKVSEKKMFGGLAFLHDGSMFCGVVGDDLMVRVGAQRYGEALARPHARPMDFTGRPLKGMVYVAPAGTADEASVRPWIEESLAFVKKMRDGGEPAEKKRQSPRVPARRGPRRATGRGGSA